jgi:L,D-transpeptidase ErfK/SrfK
MYALHGTNVPWGVGMEVSHGCVRLYPEDIDRLYHHASIGTPGRFVYQPVKYGWRGDSLYVEVHEDLYGVYPGLWRYAIELAKNQGLLDDIETIKLEKAVEEKTGVPTFVMPGPEPPSAAPPTTQSASSLPLPPPVSAASAPDADTSAVKGGSTDSDNDTDTEGDSEAGNARAAIPPPPPGNAIRPAPAPAADSAATEDSDASTSDADDVGAAPDKAPRTPDAGNGSEWHRLPNGALPLE